MTIEVWSDKSKRIYDVDNTGTTDVSDKIQSIFDEINLDGAYSATVSFAPGVYFINAPITVKLSSIKLLGNGHGGIDIHGRNIKAGTILQFGKDCAPDCITFEGIKQDCAFPSKKTPWPYHNTKVILENMTFCGYNNTDVDTDRGYSRLRGDKPNFRKLKWFPAKDRYKDPEKQGQRAIVIKSPGKYGKNEMLRVRACYFTDLYVGLDIASSDVSNITNSWFAQMVYGIRYHGNSQVLMVSNNCFADIETAMTLQYPTMSSIHDNTFAYTSKALVINSAQNLNICGNTMYNWKKAKSTGNCAAFLYIGGPSKNINISNNTIDQKIDSRTKNITIDDQPNKRSFIHFEKCEHLMVSNNIIDTVQTQTVVRLHSCINSQVVNNIIKYGAGGNAVAQTGKYSNNYCVSPTHYFEDFIY